MGDFYDRTYKIEILRESLASVAGKAFRLNIKAGEKLSSEIFDLSNRLLLPEYDSNEKIEEAEKKLEEYKRRYKTMNK